MPKVARVCAISSFTACLSFIMDDNGLYIFSVFSRLYACSLYTLCIKCVSYVMLPFIWLVLTFPLIKSLACCIAIILCISFSSIPYFLYSYFNRHFAHARGSFCLISLMTCMKNLTRFTDMHRNIISKMP